MKDLTSVIAAAVAFAVTAGSGYFVIPYLKKLKFGQTISNIVCPNLSYCNSVFKKA